MRPARFDIEFAPESGFEGYTTGAGWNGFACPYFTRDQADIVVTTLVSAGGRAWYDEAADAYVFVQEDVPVGQESEAEEVDRYDACTGVFGPGGETLYAIGAWAWCWNEIPEEEQ